MSIIHSYYKHIDNGGLQIKVISSNPGEEEIVPHLEFSESFHGYAKGSLKFYTLCDSNTFREISSFFMEAAIKLEEIHKEQKEK